jgi:undecaprenyl-diphosphatase
MDTIQAIIIAIVEGLTEFLPISSTAHMRLTEHFLGIDDQNDFSKMFTVAIQFGAILSVVVFFWKKFMDFKNLGFYIKLGLAVVPALIFGKLFNDKIDEVLESPMIMASIILLGGIFFLFADKLFTQPEILDEKDVKPLTAVKIGAFQCLAILLPGLSRSASTIIGGMSLKLSRKAAAEFSFFLAVPTMLAATAYKLLKYHKETGFQAQDLKILAIGNVVAFVVALMAIKFFIGFLNKYGFKPWGYYRIVLGAILLIYFAQ